MSQISAFRAVVALQSPFCLHHLCLQLSFYISSSEIHQAEISATWFVTTEFAQCGCIGIYSHEMIHALVNAVSIWAAPRQLEKACVLVLAHTSVGLGVGLLRQIHKWSILWIIIPSWPAPQSDTFHSFIRSPFHLFSWSQFPPSTVIRWWFKKYPHSTLFIALQCGIAVMFSLWQHLTTYRQVAVEIQNKLWLLQGTP